MKMVQVGLLGHFGFGKNLLNGQTVKTNMVASCLEKKLGAGQIIKFDSSNGLISLISIMHTIGKLMRFCKNIIIFPAQRGLLVYAPIMCIFNVYYKRKTHYCVIGGWLPQYLEKHKVIKKCIKAFDKVYVETDGMKAALNEMGLDNVVVMPNFKTIDAISKDEIGDSNSDEIQMCTFSRVMKEKGIEDAIDAVRLLNEMKTNVKYTLDIYGQIDSFQQDWFEQVMSSAPPNVKYSGTVPPDQSVNVLKNYSMLLFPTYYDGEGFAGTLIDAMFAGIPSVASDWKYNSEIINSKNGVLCEICNAADIKEKIIIVQKQLSKAYRISCLEEGKKYYADNAINILLNQLR